jgi:Skp family chaperone for outer membrane proteins
MGAYFIFAYAMRPKVEAENPDMKVVEVAKHIGELWKGMSAEQKEQYQQQADDMKAQYDQDMQQYNKQLAKLMPQLEKQQRLVKLKAGYEVEIEKYRRAAALKAQYEEEMDECIAAES